jgi:acetyl-CoA carboxylase biotin carboxylase subunit
MKIKRVLIANRGEIALRITRSLKEMGVTPIAIFSDIDRNSLHVRNAAEAYFIGKSEPALSYLNIEKIIRLAKKIKADAIHPGYGFLSENADFALACEKSGIIFIGPPSNVIKNMGDKIFSRKMAAHARVVTIPGINAKIENIEEVKKIARELSYPILIKAASGGGGKGMRIVNNESELEEKIKTAKSEAKASFGDDSIYIEKYLDSPKHIEFQIFADLHGNVVHLFERECSIQRRHQKVIEEAPSLFVDQTLREKMGKIAIRLATDAKYVGAGTIEFLVDKNKNFYFLEMNTRIQVEHPVTELTTGIDFVKEQINIAEGKSLSFKQNKLHQVGHAIELRIYAEDPFNNFAPSCGKITHLKNPEGPYIRLDSCIYENYEIPVFYDPIIAKLCVWGQNREEAIERAKRALSEYEINGVKNNIYLHKKILDDPVFVKSKHTVDFLEKNLDRLLKEEDPHIVEALIAASLHNENNKEINKQIKSKWKFFGRIKTLNI